MTGARCLLLDEPTSSLDIVGSDEIDALIARHAADGGCAIVSRHGDSVPAGWAVVGVACSNDKDEVLFAYGGVA